MFRSGPNIPHEGQSINNYLTLQALGNAMRPMGMRQLEVKNRRDAAKDLLHAVQGQDRAVVAEAESDLDDAVAVAAEWGVL
jgi:hypothetical protein